MQYWWVNQNQTYKTEIGHGFLWSPKLKANGVRNQFYENMRHVSPGDVVFSFADTRIKAIGVATGTAQSAPKPAYGDSGLNWSDDGWLVHVSFHELTDPIRPKDHIESLRPFLPTKYSPLSGEGDGYQSVYLAAVPQPLAEKLIELLGEAFRQAVNTLRNAVDGSEAVELADDREEQQIDRRIDIGPTEKLQLVKARRGQGIFRDRVKDIEVCCRLTAVSDTKHLRASHIKPWRDSTDDEKLHGSNGLLLAPHIDHLFDQGYISFSDTGDLLISPKLANDVLQHWGIAMGRNVGTFSAQQQEFLAYHREHVFKR